VQSYQASHGGKKYGAMCGDKKSMEPLKVATNCEAPKSEE
jgi:hypothetical protein